MDALLSQIKDIASSADVKVRHQISEKLRELALSVATPRQTMIYYGYMYTEQAMARTAVELGLFTILDESKTPLGIENIASKSGGDPAIIGRILRYLASAHMVSEVGEQTFAANNTTRALATTPGKSSIKHGFDFLNKTIQELPDFLKEKGYRDVNTPLDAPFQHAYKTDMQCFPWMQQHPETVSTFQPSLSTFESPTSWTTVVPLKEILSGMDGSAPLFVDIGGGYGFQCAAFRKATSEQFRGRVINQDLPETLASAPKYEDIEMMMQDFFEEQKIQGAAIYYLKNVLHDHPDTRAQDILRRTKAAMGPRSVLLIDELVIPNTGASRISVQLDMTMMSVFGATERTESDWRRLLHEVGFEIRKIHRYDPEIEYGILEAMVASK